jgi:MFS family permease
MPAQLVSLASLFTGTAVLLIGHGLHLSLLPLRAGGLGWTESSIGLTGTCYFAGFLLGCLAAPRLINSVGHVRVFGVLTATMTAALLGLSLTGAFSAWLALRAAIGWSIAGIYLVIESWLNEAAGEGRRGLVLAAYTMTALLSMAVGQLLLTTASPQGHAIVVLAAICISLAAVPVGLTRVAQPGQVPAASFRPLVVLRTARSAALSSLLAGVVTGCFYGMGPLYGARMGLDVSEIGWMMACGILGGAIMQLPLGRLSDTIDRRKVLLVIMLAAVTVCLLGTRIDARWLPLLMFAFGCTVMPIYALALAHAGDKVKTSFLEMGTGVLMLNAAGATLGPLITGGAMALWGNSAFFAVCAAVLALGAAGNGIFILSAPEQRPHFSPFEVATTASAQGALELDPRSTDAGEAERAP